MIVQIALSVQAHTVILHNHFCMAELLPQKRAHKLQSLLINC